MYAIIHPKFRRALEAKGITVVKEGAKKVPAKGLEVSLSACEAAGAVKYRVPRRVKGFVGEEVQELLLGNALYAVFDTTVHYNGAIGKLVFGFSEVIEGGTLRDTSESVNVGVFTDERMREAVAVT